MLACVWGGGGREAGQASGHWNEPFLCLSCWCAPVFWVQCLFFYLTRAVPAISKQNIVPTKRWYSPFPLFWDYLAWILPHDYAGEIMMISGNNQVSCLVLLQGKSVTCGGTLSWMARRKTFAIGLWGFFWDSSCSRGRSSWPATLSIYICHSVLFASTVPCGESELSCLSSLPWLLESTS